MSDDHTDNVAAARADVERTREELGETVEALAHKADVKARAHDKAETLKDKAEDTARQLKGKAEVAAQQAKPAATKARGRAELVAARARQLPSAGYLGLAAGAVVVGALLLRGRSR